MEQYEMKTVQTNNARRKTRATTQNHSNTIYSTRPLNHCLLLRSAVCLLFRPPLTLLLLQAPRLVHGSLHRNLAHQERREEADARDRDRCNGTGQTTASAPLLAGWVAEPSISLHTRSSPGRSHLDIDLVRVSRTPMPSCATRVQTFVSTIAPVYSEILPQGRPRRRATAEN